VYAFLNDRALELCKYAEHLEERRPGGGGCVNRLLFEIEVAPNSVELAEKADEILQRSTNPVYRPRRYDIDLATHYLVQKPIELRPFVAAFGAANAFIGKFVSDDPSLPATDCIGESLTVLRNNPPKRWIALLKKAEVRCELTSIDIRVKEVNL
jgi:hypothetical protein